MAINMTEIVRITTGNKQVELAVSVDQLELHQCCEQFEDQSIQSIEWVGLRSESKEHFFFGYFEN
jgi:hypothetical protein